MRGFIVVTVLMAAALGAGLAGPACGGSSEDAAVTLQPGFARVGIGSLQVLAEVPEGNDFYRGLGGRQSLADDRGMLFVFSASGEHQFWMRGMVMAIDIIWMSSDGRVVDIQTAQPEPGVADADLKRYNPRGPASYVLEVRAGLAAEKGVSVGDEAEIELH
jgi:uncharacterized membrane protein (UPF0127 family)